MPPSDVVPVAATSDEDPSLAIRIRSHLEALAPSAPTISYGALARVLGLWQPGSVRRITRALEDTMREDAHAGRPFIAARIVSRATYGLPRQRILRSCTRPFARASQERHGESIPCPRNGTTGTLGHPPLIIRSLFDMDTSVGRRLCPNFSARGRLVDALARRSFFIKHDNISFIGYTLTKKRCEP